MIKVNFWIIQLIGALAWIVLVASYYRKTTNKILIFHIASTILDSIHYFLLGGISGAITCIFESIRDYGYYKTDEDDVIFKVSIPIYIAIALLSTHSIIDFLPILSSVIDGYTLTKGRKTVIIGAIFAYSLWVIYAIFVKSYVGIIVDGILVISNLSILIFDKGLFKNKNIRMK